MADTTDLIPAVNQPSLPEALVRGYILDALRSGRCHSAQYHTIFKRFVLTTRNYNEIGIDQGVPGQSWHVFTVDERGHPVYSGSHVSSLRGLNLAVLAAISSYGDYWGNEPSTLRLNQGQYASNIGRLAGLIGNRQVEAIFDPYLCNDTLLVVTDLASVGGFSLSQDLRLLAGEKTIQGKTPRLTKSFVEGWLEERGLPGGKAKVKAEGHERFLLLSGGVALALGFSLNNPTHDESAHIVADTERRKTFETKWAAAALLT